MGLFDLRNKFKNKKEYIIKVYKLKFHKINQLYLPNQQ